MPDTRPSRGFTLIELLIVIAILGILMALLFPAVSSALDAAKKTQAKNDVTQIATAIVAYETEYGKLPEVSGSDNTLNAASNGIIGTLMGTRTNENPRGIVFLEVGTWKKGKGGIKDGNNFCDPWGNAYQIVLDGNYDNSITVSSGKETAAGSTNETLRKKVAVYNVGNSVADSKASNYFRHAAKSW